MDGRWFYNSLQGRFPGCHLKNLHFLFLSNSFDFFIYQVPDHWYRILMPTLLSDIYIYIYIYIYIHMLYMYICTKCNIYIYAYYMYQICNKYLTNICIYKYNTFEKLILCSILISITTKRMYGNHMLYLKTLIFQTKTITSTHMRNLYRLKRYTTSTSTKNKNK